MKKQLLLSLVVLATMVSLSKAQTITLWGMTEDAGVGDGNVFKITSTGVFTNEYSFQEDTNGALPTGSLLQANNGLLYGLVQNGDGSVGTNEHGGIFKFNPATGEEKTLYLFGNTTLDGYWPHGTLIQATNGQLYGTTESDNDFNFGTIFSYDITTNTETMLHLFEGGDGANPYGDLLQVNNNMLYGMTSTDGSNGGGTIFKYNIDSGTESTLYGFGSGTDGSAPKGSLIKAPNGLLYGLTSEGGANGMGIIFSFDTATDVETDVHDFSGYPDDGSYPWASLLLANNGLLYGLTSSGGSADGTLFSFSTTSGKETVLYNFGNSSGDAPVGNLMQASDGKLYGMTSQDGQIGAGTVFNYDIASNTFNDFYNFNGSDGNTPNGALIELNSTGIAQLNINNNQVVIYPNPTANQLTVESGQTTVNGITITTILGEIIYKKTIDGSNSNSKSNLTIDVSTLPDGLYFISVTFGTNVVTQKLLVVRN